MKILYTNTNCSWNKGSASQVIGSTYIIRKFFNNAHFTLLSLSYEQDFKGCSPHNIRVVRFNPNKFGRRFLRYSLFWYFINLLRCIVFSIIRNFGVTAQSLVNIDVLREYFAADLIVDLSGDSYSDGEGGNSLVNSLNLLIAIFLKKPFVLFSQSIGPFKPLTLWLTKFCLKRANLIILRENVSKRYLESIGISNLNIYVTADVAFIFEPASSEIVNKILSTENIVTNNQLVIGLSVSELVYRSFEVNEDQSNNKYISIMGKIVDYLIEKFNVLVIFVPHVFLENSLDDRVVARKILSNVKNKEKTRIITNEYTPEELRGIINNCDLFIGARMHANISAISMHVPTIAISWSHKYYGIMKKLGQEKYVFNVKTMTFNELVIKVNDAWNNREKIRNTLEKQMNIQQEQALLNGKLVKNSFTLQ